MQKSFANKTKLLEDNAHEQQQQENSILGFMLSGLPPIHYLTFSLSLSVLQRLLKFSQASIFLIMCLLQVTLNKKSSGLSVEVELAWKKIYCLFEK